RRAGCRTPRAHRDSCLPPRSTDSLRARTITGPWQDGTAGMSAPSRRTRAQRCARTTAQLYSADRWFAGPGKTAFLPGPADRGLERDGSGVAEGVGQLRPVIQQRRTAPAVDGLGGAFDGRAQLIVQIGVRIAGALG